MIDFDSLVNDPRFHPYHGWHDDHVSNDGTSFYLPMIHQDRSEWLEFARILNDMGLNRRCLQLGLGPVGGAHYVLQQMFSEVFTIDYDQESIDRYLARVPEHSAHIIFGKTSDNSIIHRFDDEPLFDLVFIDADHSYDGVRQDFDNYKDRVRRGGMIAFHDSVNTTYNIEVGKFLDSIRLQFDVITIGDFLGISYIIR